MVPIGYETSVINGHGWCSSYDTKRDIHRSFDTYRATTSTITCGTRPTADSTGSC